MTATLEARFYHDTAIYARERSSIFAQAWWLLGPEAQLGATGDFIADVVCGWPVVAVKTDGGLKAFHNVCRHRASPLVPVGTGQCEHFRCPYHGWLYSLSGELERTPQFSDSQSDRPSVNLWPVKIDTWSGLVFIQIDGSGPTLPDWLGHTADLVLPFAGPQDLDYYDCFSVSGNANWKTYCDNTVEGYHLNMVHPRLSQSLRQGEVDIKSYDDGRTVAFHVRYGNQSDGADLRGAEGVWVYKFPGFQLVAGANLFKAERVEATGATTLRSSNWSWFGHLSEADKADAFRWGRQIVEEDLGVCEGVQTNLMAGIYEQGPLSPLQETHTARFQELVRTAVMYEQ